MRTWTRWAARHHLDIPDLVHRAHGRRSLDTVREVAPALDADVEVRWLAEVELSDAEGLSVLAGAHTVYEEMPDPHRAVVTSGGRALAQFRLAAVGLSIPDIVVSAEDVERGKPSPDGYLLAAERLGVHPKDCLVVEDTPAGIAAGRAAGAQVLAVATTFPITELSGADIVVPSLAPVTSTVVDGQVHLAIAGNAYPMLPDGELRRPLRDL